MDRTRTSMVPVAASGPGVPFCDFTVFFSRLPELHSSRFLFEVCGPADQPKESKFKVPLCVQAEIMQNEGRRVDFLSIQDY